MEKSQISHLNSYFRNLEKEEQNKSKQTEEIK